MSKAEKDFIGDDRSPKGIYGAHQLSFKMRQLLFQHGFHSLMMQKNYLEYGLVQHVST